MKKATALLSTFLASILLAAACQKKAETASAPAPAATTPEAAAATAARVERVTVAKSVNADDSPGETAASFGRNDTVYVSLWTANAPVGTEITARWFGPDGAQITEDKIVTDQPGDGYTSFHAANTNGWQPGNYRVEILLNGQPAGSVAFLVG